MQAASLEILEDVEVPSPVARAIVQVFDIEFTEAKKNLASKQDLIELGHTVEMQFERSRGSVQVDMANLKSGLMEEIHGAKSDLTRQMYVAIAAQMALLFGIFYFFVTHMVK